MTKFVLDNCSLNILLKYYYFDKDKICKKILDFFIEKIEKGEIIIIDKVFDELKKWTMASNEKEYLQKGIDKFKKDTSTPEYLEAVNNLIDNNIIQRQAENLSPEAKETELQKYRDTIADLYLVAYCQKLKLSKNDPILITEESRGSDGKLIKKIPSICYNNAIRYEKIPFIIFEHYKKELDFKLNE